jgi:hypothetical protein
MRSGHGEACGGTATTQQESQDGGCDPRVEGESRVSVARAKGVAHPRRGVKRRKKVRRGRAARAKVSTCSAKLSLQDHLTPETERELRFMA